MNLELANRLKDAADDLGIEATVYEDYSGRGMYGKTTAGLVIPNLLDIAAIAARAACSCLAEGDDAEEMVSELEKLSSDNMGLEWIVY